MRHHGSQAARQDYVLHLADAMLLAGGWGSSLYCFGGEEQVGIVLDVVFPFPASLVSHYVRALVVPILLAAARLRVAYAAAPRSRDLDSHSSSGHGVGYSL